MKLNDNIKDFITEAINSNESTFKTIELIEAGVFAPYEVLEALK
jgi:hypothetical protein